MIKNKELSVSIILVNFNGWQDTIECLESLIKINYSNYRIVVVDNASTDNSAKFIQEWAKGNINYNFNSSFISKELAFPPSLKPINLTVLNDEEIYKNRLQSIDKLTLIRSHVNLGFAGGNNLATKLLMSVTEVSSFFWYLNNDTVVEKNSLYELVKQFQVCLNSGIRLGLLGSKLMYYHKPDTIQAIGGLYNRWFATTQHLGINEIDYGQYDIPLKRIHLDYIVGASMLVSKEFIEKVGLMSEDYFLYFEEIDWILKGKVQGFTFTYCSKSIVYHKEGASIGTNMERKLKSELSDYYNIKNRLKITRKYFPKFIPVVYLVMFGVILNRLRRRQFKRIPMIIKLILKA